MRFSSKLAALSALLLGASAYPASIGQIEERQAGTPFWMESIKHQGISAFGASGYQVFRNVKDFGAKGDGKTDDTAAIQAAISFGGRCGMGCRTTSTTQPAVVYFPSGTYSISQTIIDYYYTQLIGNANNPPILKATANFQGGSLIDGDTYPPPDYGQNWGSTNIFYRQIRNFVFDSTLIAAGTKFRVLHWPTAQATSIQFVTINMPQGASSNHRGIFIENGSAGFLSDITTNGGLLGLEVGNQQYTMRSITINNAQTAIQMGFAWGWLFADININNCQLGIDMTSGGTTNEQVATLTFIDSHISNTPVGIKTAYSSSSMPAAAGGLQIENVILTNVPVAVQGPTGTVLAGGSLTITGWGEGHEYTPTGPTSFEGPIAPNARPASLLAGSSYYIKSKPQYGNLPLSSFVSVRTAGAKGDGATDDTTALQNILNSAATANQVVYFDAGTYKVTSTLTIPANSKVVGETYSVIMSSGAYFNDYNNPKAVVRVGAPGGAGSHIEWSDMIVSTQGQQKGAILIEYNMNSGGTPTGIWDVHTRVGGFAGSNLGSAQCPKTPSSTTVNQNCIAAYMLMHIVPGSQGLYMENNWLWTADHDIDAGPQIDIYSARGMLIESTAGKIWLWGTAVEHNNFYQYQLTNTQNIFAGFVQTETPYYQPNPEAPAPFTPVTALNDPNFATSCAGQGPRCYDAWGMRVLNSKNTEIYGMGLYSFFDNWNGSCVTAAAPNNCQVNIFSIEGSSSQVNVYGYATVGVTNMITKNGAVVATNAQNPAGFPQAISVFKSG